MAKSCSIIPQVRNNKDQIVDSRLFKDLLAFSGDRKETNRIYYITKGEEFIKKWFPKLVIDENNEPTIRSLFKYTNLKDYISESKIMKKLNIYEKYITLKILILKSFVVIIFVGVKL